MIEVQELLDTNTVQLTMSDAVTAQELDNTLAKLKAAIEQHGGIRLLENIGELDTPPIPWSKLWADAKFSFEHLSDVTHVAVVADQGWVAAYVNMLNPLMKAEIKQFERAEMEVAGPGWHRRPSATRRPALGHGGRRLGTPSVGPG